MPLDAVIVFPLLTLLVKAAGPRGRAATPGTARSHIECLPTGELVVGHGLLVALRERGVDAVNMVVREDLGRLPLDVQGLHVLRNYLNEIGADEATRARLFRVWEKWRLSLKRKGPRVARRVELDEQIQAVLGVSRRTLLRHRVVESLAPSVKGTLSALKLPNWASERIARLRTPQQQCLLTELRDTDDVREVLTRHFPDRSSSRHKKASNALAAFVRALGHGRADLEGREQQIGRLSIDYAAELRAARALIDRLLGDESARTGDRV